MKTFGFRCTFDAYIDAETEEEAIEILTEKTDDSSIECEIDDIWVEEEW